MQEERALNLRAKYRAIISNCKSSYILNYLIEFDRGESI